LNFTSTSHADVFAKPRIAQNSDLSYAIENYIDADLNFLRCETTETLVGGWSGQL